jgi:hypothetical protein
MARFITKMHHYSGVPGWTTRKFFETKVYTENMKPTPFFDSQHGLLGNWT